MKIQNVLLIVIVGLIMLVVLSLYNLKIPVEEGDNIERFSSGAELVKAFEDARSNQNIRNFGIMEKAVTAEGATAAPQAASGTYSETNIQVAGVDEADIIKTDGAYIYAIANGNLVIVRAYPSEDAEILSTTKFKDFYPQELFIQGDRLLIFGSANYNVGEEQPEVQTKRVASPSIMPPRYWMSFMSARLYDISDKEDPEIVKTFDFEGNYLTSRKIGKYAYFVINSYPQYYGGVVRCETIVPKYRESTNDEEPKLEEMQPIAKCTDIGYIEPIQAESFITIASISMEDETMEKEIIVGSGQNVYASLDNMYVAQTTWPRYHADTAKLMEDSKEKTVITKFNLDNGNIEFAASGDVKGTILNQFSMDEFNNYFRIATTTGEVWDTEQKSENNVYVLDNQLEVVGELEDLAPGERIYSVRFMGNRGYVVTFKKIDPLFVIDLSTPESPEILGKLKIPGYSDYLHPYDETHIIGIGKEAVDAEGELGRSSDFAWYQGVKMAVFDVSDVENPIEMHKVVIGDRGTDSEALYEHKAFLFDRQKELLVIPITLAEIKGEKTEAYEYGEFVFQGAYVYNINLDDGFELRGRVTHYDDNETFMKSGYYFRGDYSIRRSLYIDSVLYTFSNSRLQLNDLDTLEKIEALEFEQNPESPGEIIIY